jgi:hypothetical protein
MHRLDSDGGHAGWGRAGCYEKLVREGVALADLVLALKAVPRLQGVVKHRASRVVFLKHKAARSLIRYVFPERSAGLYH